MPDMKLADVACVLGCHKATASRLVRGEYDKDSELPQRYAALVRLVEAAQQEVAHERICVACPREDCTGCRLAEI